MNYTQELSDIQNEMTLIETLPAGARAAGWAALARRVDRVMRDVTAAPAPEARAHLPQIQEMITALDALIADAQGLGSNTAG